MADSCLPRSLGHFEHFYLDTYLTQGATLTLQPSSTSPYHWLLGFDQRRPGSGAQHHKYHQRSPAQMLLTTEERGFKPCLGPQGLVVTWGVKVCSKTRSDAGSAQALADLPLAYWSRTPFTWGEHFSDNTSSERVFGTIFPKHLITPVYPPSQ